MHPTGELLLQLARSQFLALIEFLCYQALYKHYLIQFLLEVMYIPSLQIRETMSHTQVSVYHL